MENWKNRLLEEEKELLEKIDKLSKFLGSSEYSSLSYEDQNLLLVQHYYMLRYHRILAERVHRL